MAAPATAALKRPRGDGEPASPAAASAPNIEFLSRESHATALIRECAFSVDGAAFAMASEDCHVHVYDPSRGIRPKADAKTASPVGAFSLPELGCNHVVFLGSHNNRLVVTPSNARACCVVCLDASTGAVAGAYHVPGDSSAAVDRALTALEPCGDRGRDVFAVARADANVYFYDASVARPIAHFDVAGGRELVGRPALAWSARDDGRLLAVSDEGYLRLYDWRKLRKDGPVSVFDDPTGDRIVGMHFHPIHPDDQLLITSADYSLTELSVKQGAATTLTSPDHDPLGYSLVVAERAMSHLADKRQLPCVARYSPDGALAAVGTVTQKVCFFDVGAGSRRRLTAFARPLYEGLLATVAWSPREKVLAACHRDVFWYGVT